MNDEVLKSIANAILTKLAGPGCWHTYGQKPYKKITNPLLGLSVGDIVYAYAEDEQELQEERVIAVVAGIGYVLWTSTDGEPELIAVSDDCYQRTPKKAAEYARQEIENDIEYYQDRYDRIIKLKAMLDNNHLNDKAAIGINSQ